MRSRGRRRRGGSSGGGGPRRLALIDWGTEGRRLRAAVERHQRAIARIPDGRDAALDHELVKAAERQALDAEVEIERRRLAYDAAPELVI